MSSSATPISHARFSSAIKDLPLGNLYSSAAELRNSIAHLRSSNEQLGPFASGEDADQDCVDAIKENEEVIERMVARIEILKGEVEGRGYKWVEPEEEEEEEEEGVVNGHVGVGDGDGEVDEEEDEGQDEEEEEEENNSESRGGPARTDAATARTGSHHGGSIGDEELRRLVEERLLHGDNNNNDDDDDDDGGLDL